ncbi:hypothetical protein PRZ48_006061 [Zasmidium cellare]|uniref:NTF2-like domain-containing protein n=1 Tax=Zasmidium cellare TaxID=395010 RepID=A0ABR0EN88_ZASCE|nr:hypothetical protein PRZ48_006061 [Zasmidium cellare]
MVALKSLALLSFAAAGILAAPASGGSQCMTDDQANVVAEAYGELIANYNEDLANAILTEDFTDYSEGVNTLINTCPQGSAAMTLPLLAATFTNREEFEVGQGQQPHINFKQLNLWNACSSVIIRWETTNTANITAPKPVIGLIVMETVKAPAGSQYPFLIKQVFSEFDAGAWLQNLQEAGICPTTDCGPAAPGPAPGNPAPAPGQPQPNNPAPFQPAPSQPQPAPGNPQPNPAPAPQQPNSESCAHDDHLGQLHHYSMHDIYSVNDLDRNNPNDELLVDSINLVQLVIYNHLVHQHLFLGSMDK